MVGMVQTDVMAGIAPAELTEVDRSRLQAARGEFDAEVIYLNTATLGLPPRRCLAAVQAALREWQAGRADPMDYDGPLAAARLAYAGLVDVDPTLVAVGSQVSVFAGLVAAGLPAGSEVLTAIGDFTSILFPFHAQAARGVSVREVPLEQIADAVGSATRLVSVSAVQSADGRLVDLDRLEEACAITRTKVLLDTTQAVGWLPIDASRFAYTVCGGYKWLLAPRGTAYLTIQAELLDSLIPHAAGWYAGASPWESIYGAPLRLAADSPLRCLTSLARLDRCGTVIGAAHRDRRPGPPRPRRGLGQRLPCRDRPALRVLRDRLRRGRTRSP